MKETERERRDRVIKEGTRSRKGTKDSNGMMTTTRAGDDGEKRGKEENIRRIEREGEKEDEDEMVSNES